VGLAAQKEWKSRLAAHPAFVGLVILFQTVRGAVLAIVGQITCDLESSNGGQISGVPVGV
jgi:hypothetical protein